MNAAVAASPAIVTRGRRVVLVTKHAKERALYPVVRAHLGGVLEVLQLDTDRFGTFTGEVRRVGTQRDALRAKLRAAADATPYDALFLASEGAFFPHPEQPFLTLNRELVGLYDRNSGVEVVGCATSTETPAVSESVSNHDELNRALDAAHFPSHGVLVLIDRQIVARGVHDIEAVLPMIEAAWASGVEVRVESDARAQHNPTRMSQIEAAALDLAQRLSSLCPQCEASGFWYDGVRYGRPCDLCGGTTGHAQAHVATCAQCGFVETRDVAGPSNPAFCESCNP